MYKGVSRFRQSLRNRGLKVTSRTLTSYDVVRRQLPNEYEAHLAKSLDAEVRAVTPSLRKKGETVGIPTYRSSKKFRRRGTVAPTEQRIYLVEFNSRAHRQERFLKIGVSTHDVYVRFQADLKNYAVRLVAETKFYARSDAKTVERALHQMFRAETYRPRIPLMSGNTECFKYTEAIKLEICKIIQQFVFNYQNSRNE